MEKAIRTYPENLTMSANEHSELLADFQADLERVLKDQGVDVFHKNPQVFYNIVQTIKSCETIREIRQTYPLRRT